MHCYNGCYEYAFPFTTALELLMDGLVKTDKLNIEDEGRVGRNDVAESTRTWTDMINGSMIRG